MNTSQSKGVAELSPLTFIEDIFGEGGLLAQESPSYKPRPEQIALAGAFYMHLLRHGAEDGDIHPFVSEAPCGTGKTFAYLFPLLYCLLGRRKIILSTAGIGLQEQLVKRDVPFVIKILQKWEAQREARHLPKSIVVAQPQVVLLKGTANYLCPHKLSQEDAQRYLPMCRPTIASWVRHAARMQYNYLADTAEAPSPLNAEEADAFTTSGEECLGSKCPKASACPALRNRKAANMAHVVVQNHHLLATEVSRRSDQGRPYILADEAHELLSVFRDAATRKLTVGGWDKAVRRIIRGALQDEASLRILQVLQENNPVKELGLRCRSPGLYWTGSGTKDLDMGPLHLALETVRRLFAADLFESGNAGDLAHRAAERLRDTLACLTGEGGAFVVEEDPSGGVKEGYLVHPSLYADLTPVDAHFSATLRFNQKYDAFLREGGLLERGNPRTFTAKSPFDWARQALVVMPGEGVDPSLPRPQYDAKLSNIAREVTRLTGGRTLFCCTSWSSVKAVAAALREGPYEVLVQGEHSKTNLLRKFVEDTSSIAVGTLSLWTGVDVPGEALTCLVIDKIPFRGGLDPWLEKRKQGDKDWFRNLVLPEVGTLLAQGFGRLIRSTSDVGVCVLLDPRMYPKSNKMKPYAQALLRTMFPEDCNFSDTLDDIPAFLEWAKSPDR